MRSIPAKLRKDMEDDPYYKNCCITGMPGTAIKLEWHHNLIFAGKQVQEKFAILPICYDIHERVKSDQYLRGRLDWIMLNRATDEQLKKYSKAEDLFAKKKRLNKKYGDQGRGFVRQEGKAK